MTENTVLEVVNNLRTINQIVVTVYLSGFLVWGMRSSAAPQTVMMSDARRMGMCLGFALLIHYGGASIIGVTIWVLRAAGIGGGIGAAPLVAIPGMVLGSLLLAASALLVLRIMSITKFGNALWIALVAVDVAYLAAVLY